MKVITTIPPYAPFLEEIAMHPIVEGFRLNTVMPVRKQETLEDLLGRLKNIAGDKPVWIDIKCRQLRVSRGRFYNSPKEPMIFEIEGKKIVLDPSNPKAFGDIVTPPWAEIEIDHKIELDTSQPVPCYMNDGLDRAYIVGVNGNKLIMLDGPQKIVGGGESINILHPSLKIKGFLTDLDKAYIEAGAKVGINTIMSSYFEGGNDVSEIRAINPNAEIVAKIESEKGLNYVRTEYNPKSLVRLMAARGDLYVEISRPHLILGAVRDIVEKDPEAIVASRILPSLRNSFLASAQDISDIGFLMEIGYRRFMVGDDICFRKESLLSALNIIQALERDYKPRKK
jgi:pyruvate kinase